MNQNYEDVIENYKKEMKKADINVDLVQFFNPSIQASID